MFNAVNVRVEKKGAPVLNLLYSCKIPVYRVKCDESLSFTIKGKDFSRFSVVCERNGICYKIVKDSRVKTWRKNNIFRFGIYVGVVIVVVSCVFYGRYLTRYEITGTDVIDREIIEKVLSDYVAFPAKKQDVDVKNISNAIQKTDGVAGASVYKEGNILKIKISEELPKVGIFNRADFADVTAKYDAVVTRVIPYDGTPIVEVGDSVQCGDVLISGIIPLDEEKGLFYQTRPFGEVYGVVRISKELLFPDTRYVRKRTGNTKSVVSVFSDVTHDDPPYPLYETERTEYYLYNVFPVKVIKTTYYEVAEIAQDADFENNFEGILKTEKDVFFSELPSGAQPRDFSYAVKRLDKSTLLSLYYDVEIKIS